MIKTISKNTYGVLECLKDTWQYSVDKDMYINEINKYKTKKEIMNECKISKQTLSNVLKNKEYFTTFAKGYDLSFGLSEEGIKKYWAYYELNIAPSEVKEKVNQFKKDIDKYADKSKNKFIKIEDSDIKNFYHTFNLSFLGIREFPFEINIKLKKKFHKDKKEIYKLYMDKELI